MILDGIAWLVILLLVAAWTWAYILWRIDRSAPGILALHSAARTQQWSALLGTLVALLAASRLRLGGFMLPNEVAVVILVVIFVGINVPGVIGLWLYLTGRFD